MRITKVKEEKKEVLMERNQKQGYLVYGKDKKRGHKILTFLDTKKQDSFLVSILDKTLVKAVRSTKETTRDEKKRKNDCLKLLKELFDAVLREKSVDGISERLRLLQISNMRDEEVKAYLSHRFQKDVEFEGRQFNLLNDLRRAIKTKRPDDLDVYKDWAGWYLDRRKRHLERSITNNRIDFFQNQSVRKQVLSAWANQLVNDEQIQLNNLELTFSIEALQKKWMTVFLAERKRLETDFNKNIFEFKRNLKSILQKHQKSMIVEGGEKDNKELNQYSLEVSKYLNGYFPLKTSQKKLSIQNIEYYLDLETIKTQIGERIQNATMQYLIQQGSAFRYGFDELHRGVTSDDLRNRKVSEAFVLQFIDAIGFATNNLRNCIDPEQKNDILGGTDLKRSLEKLCHGTTNFDLEEAKKRLHQFFNSPKLSEDDFINHLSKEKFIHFVSAIRGAIQRIRNKVIHYKKDAYTDILNVSDFEFFEFNHVSAKVESKGDRNFSDDGSLLSLFKNELDTIQLFFAEKLKSGGLFEYYDIENIQKVFHAIQLCPKPLPFAPGFKSVFKWGVKYQFEQDNPLQLRTYFRRYANEDADEAGGDVMPEHLDGEARRYALKLVYEQRFVPDFLDDEEAFFDAVRFILHENEKRAQGTRNKNAWAFHDIISLEEWRNQKGDKSVKAYLQSVQSSLIQEENKKREEGVLESTETGHFQKFLWQVFLKGFDTYISEQDDLEFIAYPQYQLNGRSAAERSLELNKLVEAFENFEEFKAHHSILKETVPELRDSQIAFWLFCKMLDARHLNELGNQFEKLMQFNVKNEQGKSVIETIEIRQEIIQLCLLTADYVPGSWESLYQDRAEYKTVLNSYVNYDWDKGHLFELPYFQEDSITPVIFSQIELARKYVTDNIFRQMMERYADMKVDDADIRYWAENKTLAIGWSKDRQKLHDSWANTAKKREWADTLIKECGKSNQVYYQELCNKLDEYNWRNNKVHFVHIKNLHHLLIDILGRFLGFVALFDRDFQFLDESSSCYRKDDPYRMNEFISFGAISNILDRLHENRVISKKGDSGFPHDPFSSWQDADKKALKDALSEKHSFYRRRFFKEQPEIHNYRNYIAHFNYLTKTANKGSILDMLSFVRALVSYDRKLKNAVAKSFIDLLKKHGIEIKFKPLHEHDHQFEIASIKPVSITHLRSSSQSGKKGRLSENKKPEDQVMTNLVHKEYVDMVRALLEFK